MRSLVLEIGFSCMQFLSVPRRQLTHGVRQHYLGKRGSQFLQKSCGKWKLAAAEGRSRLF